MTGLKNAKRVVVKVGTSTLTHSSGKTNLKNMQALVRTVSDLANFGIQVALVSSGAIGVGVGKLRLSERPGDTPSRQAAACIGQCELMFMYDKLFSEYGHVVGQMLITRSDVENAERRANLINAFEKLFEYGCIPIVNENDSVAVEEIVFGDNDRLSATVAQLTGADALIILTDIDGLYDKNPNDFEDAMLIPYVEKITPEIMALAGGVSSNRGTGGMVTKLLAAEYATENGIDTFIINGSDPDGIYKMLDGRQVGTYFKGKCGAEI